MKIVLVEDDQVLAQLISDRLRKEHYVVEMATNGLEGLKLTRVTAADLWIIDIELPKLNGFQLCQRLRQQGIQAPVLLLTARRGETDLLTGFNLGADDYLVKPFQISELLVRVRALLRRPRQLQNTLLSWGVLELSTETATVTYGGKPVSLRPKEYKLLEILMRHGRQILSYEQLFDQLWTLEETPNKESLKAHIKGLRKALKQIDAPLDIIEAIRGLGVRLNPTYETAEPKNSESSSILSQLQEAWPSFKPKMMERIQLIETALGHLEKGQLSPDRREQARTAAHTLAGSLGTFGFAGGTQLAQELEDGLSFSSESLQRLQEKILQLRKELEQDPFANPSPRDLSLLLIGSNPETLAILKSFSSQSGIRLEQVACPRDAKLLMGSVNVLLLDLDHPKAEEQGIQLAKRFGIPYILVLQEDQLAARIEARRKGASGCVISPCPPELLLQTVRRAAQKVNPLWMNVLAVDDDPHFLEILKVMLGNFSQLTFLQDPREFWPVLQSIMPDVLLLDVKMPHFSGIDLCHAVRTDSRFDRIPIVMITGHPDELSAAGALAIGANDYLSKPIHSQELHLCLARHRFGSASAVASMGS
ncbi:response regulator [Synechococcus sp. Nb3U1]|uniref:response regulator n=1 Tax=Synechococcus sp. Nb3U1 TaxID=1914529 RepID=UPI001F3508D0|nr:response regulator [Synechococcus sp. Nb3U1]MCF2970497.1 response regulator [Synechococcus sp. Nb3U1]